MKNFAVRKTESTFDLSISLLEQFLEPLTHEDCAPTDQIKLGWLRFPQTGTHVLKLTHHYVMRCRVQSKSVPADIVKKEQKKIAEKYIHDTGTNPSKSLMKEFKEQALINLLPRAFVAIKDCFVILDIKEGYIYFENASNINIKRISGLMRSTISGFPAIYNPVAVIKMSSYMHKTMVENAEAGFSLGLSAELYDPEELKPSVKYANHDLAGDEITSYLRKGYVPKSVQYEDEGEFTFTLNNEFFIKNLSFSKMNMDRIEDAEENFGSTFIIYMEAVSSIRDEFLRAGTVEPGEQAGINQDEQDGEEYLENSTTEPNNDDFTEATSDGFDIADEDITDAILVA